MRNHSMFQFRLVISSIALAIASFSPASQAQTPEFQAKTIIPFGFEVGSTHFAPGPLSLRNENDRIVSVRSNSDGVLAIMRHEANLASPASKLVFHKYGDRYFLAEVWTKGSSLHLCLIQSKAETKAQRLEQASNQKPVKNNSVEVALLQNSNR